MGPCARAGYALVCFYRVTFGLLLGGRCRFLPSCSAYALDALAIQPFGAALLLVGRRLTRCHPWHPGGIDPVPNFTAPRAPSPLSPEATVAHE